MVALARAISQLDTSMLAQNSSNTRRRRARASSRKPSGVALAIGCNLVNNLPAGLVAGRVAELAQLPDRVRSAVLIGVDLGPNLSVTGSLATILWLTALRREGQQPR